MRFARVSAVMATSVAIPLVLSGCDPAPTHPLSATWSMSEPAGATVMVDSSGGEHNGTIQPGVEPAPDGQVGIYQFTGSGRVIVPNDPQGGLDPYDRDMYLQVVLRTTSLGGMNIVQKGQAGSPHGYWKLEVNQGHPVCSFFGSAGGGGAWLTSDVADGQWHTITCARLGNEVATAVDYGTDMWRVNAVQRPTGTIYNVKDLTVGGKINCADLGTGCDGFVGDISSVQIW